MFNMARSHAGQPRRRRDTRAHAALYLKATNARHTDEPLPQLRFTPREALPRIATSKPRRSRPLSTSPAAEQIRGSPAAAARPEAHQARDLHTASVGFVVGVDGIGRDHWASLAPE